MEFSLKVSGSTPKFVITTPYPGLPRVTLLTSTWLSHVVYRPELIGMEPVVATTLAAPEAVCAGTSDPRNIVFVNQTERSPRGKSPFVVIVNPEHALVDSMGYRREFRDLTEHSVLWAPPNTRR